MIGKIYAIAALLALTAAGLRAQGDRGIITGTVKDPSGAAMPGAVVTAIQLATNTSYKTSHDCIGRLHRAIAAGGRLPGASRKCRVSRRR